MTVAQAMTYNFIKKENLAQVLSCEFWEILKNTFFIERLRWLLLSARIWRRTEKHAFASEFVVQETL